MAERERKRRFLEEICVAFEKVCPQHIEYLTRVIDDNRKKLRRESGMSATGRVRFTTSLPLEFVRFIEGQAVKRGITGINETPFLAVHENMQLLFQVWPDLKVGRGPEKYVADFGGIKGEKKSTEAVAAAGEDSED